MPGLPHHRPRGALLAVLLALGISLALAGAPVAAQAQARPGGAPPSIPPAQAPFSPVPGLAPPAAAAPGAVPGATAAMPSVGVGLCQCIADRAERRFECLGSPDVCQSACGSAHYSFVPYANFSCPLTAQQQTPQQGMPSLQALPPRTP